MAQVHKLLGRSAPASATPTTIYTTPALTTTIVSSFHVCNTGSGDDSIRIFFVPNGGSFGISNAIYYDLVIPVGNPFIINTVPVLMPGDFIVVRSANGNITFTASGLELS